MKVIKWIKSVLVREFNFLKLKIKLFRNGIHIDNTVKLYVDEKNFLLSSGVSIAAYTVIYALNSNHSSIPGVLLVGKNTTIGEFNNIRAAGGKIQIGNNCLISQYVSIIASNHNILSGNEINKQGWNETRTGVIIGNDVWIGANCTILPGVEIGNGCVIGAGTILTKSVPENSIVMGIPGTVIKSRT